ncbi:polyphosphate polymerase domain-containing protein [Balneolales bacterium ANBcel1]|nr:polyphosphate polymerase domain-containing protein [Balneolales bacterium ANBcel1]
MGIDTIQRQRFEHKYVINENVALGIRDFLSSYLDIDSYGATQPNLSYPVHSLYFDSPGMRTYQNTINGDRNRYKLRVRFYEQMEDAPLYFEIKRRHDKIIAKKRAIVHRHAADDVARGFLPGSSCLVDPSGEQMDALLDFSRLINHLQAEPKVHVAYFREAWVADGSNKIRVTIDRQVRSEPHKTISFSPEMSNPRLVFGNDLILELKFTNRFPNWFKDLVQIFGLRQVGAAKYVDGVTNLGEYRFLRSYV